MYILNLDTHFNIFSDFQLLHPFRRTHANPRHVEPMQIVGFQDEMKLHASAFQIIMEILISDVAQSVFRIVNVLKISLVSTTNVKIHVLEHVESKLFVQFTITFQVALVLLEQLVTHSNTVKFIKISQNQ